MESPGARHGETEEDCGSQTFFVSSSFPFALYSCNQGKKDHGGQRKFKLTLPVPLLQIPVLTWKERGCTTETPGVAFQGNLFKSGPI